MIEHLSGWIDGGFKKIDDRFKQIDDRIGDGFKRLDRWMMIRWCYRLSFDRDDAVLRGNSCYGSLFSRAGSIVQIPQNC